MITGRPRRDERTGALRARLILTIVVAALLPFLAAWWTANDYVAKRARESADARLAFTARSAAREASSLLVAARTRATALGRDAALQRAVRQRDRSALLRLLHPGEAVSVASVADGSWIGERRRGVPAARAEITFRGRQLARVSVSAPGSAMLLRRVRTTAFTEPGTVLAVARDGIVTAGPARLLQARVGRDGALRRGSETFRARSISVPGYGPPPFSSRSLTAPTPTRG